MARGRSRRGLRWAARAGILALALNALVPIHLAFDLGEALGGAHHAVKHDLEWRLIAKFIGHDAGDADDHHADPGHHHDATCPVIAAFGALTGLVTAPVPTLAQPFAVASGDPPMPAIIRPAVASAAAYRSRAPPRA